eukprot:2962581-Pleurochrysis_carterae.AAC.1
MSRNLLLQITYKEARNYFTDCARLPHLSTHCDGGTPCRSSTRWTARLRDAGTPQPATDVHPLSSPLRMQSVAKS